MRRICKRQRENEVGEAGRYGTEVRKEASKKICSIRCAHSLLVRLFGDARGSVLFASLGNKPQSPCLQMGVTMPTPGRGQGGLS